VTQLLLASNVAPLIAEDNSPRLPSFPNASIVAPLVCAICSTPKLGKIFSDPFGNRGAKLLTIERRIQLPDDYATHSEVPMVRQHLTPDGEVTDVFVPLMNDSNYLGF